MAEWPRGALGGGTVRILDGIERAVSFLTVGLAVVLLPFLIGVRVWEIYTRKVLNAPAVLYDYMEGEAFLLLVFLSLAYAYKRDAHVRVDILRDRLSPRARAVVELFGILVFVLPLAALVIHFGIERAIASYEIGERLALAHGRPWRWIVKGALPAGMALFALMALTAAARNLAFLLTGKGGPAPRREPVVGEHP